MRSLKVCHVYKFARCKSLRADKYYSARNVDGNRGVPVGVGLFWRLSGRGQEGVAGAGGIYDV